MQPLADRMRPTNLDEIIGQHHILDKNMLLRRLIESDMLSSIILYGPPGTGKTTIASVIANSTKSNFKQINATTSGKKDMQDIVDFAQKELKNNKKTILFIDEIHRFNKAQQDYLLPFVENGTITLIGATTENPYFEVNGALLSRSQIFQLEPLSKDDIKIALQRIIEKLNASDATTRIVDDIAYSFLSEMANGDARTAINALDLALRTTESQNNEIHITLEIAGNCIQKKILQYDKNGDMHYDSIAAFIEATKHGEIDAALAYLAFMLERGEDPKYIARRLFIIAAMDVGIADPNAINIASSTFHMVEKVGLPECVCALAMTTVYLATAPKTHSVWDAYDAIKTDVQNSPDMVIPKFLRDDHYKGSVILGHYGVTDIFASPDHYDGQDCMPDVLKGRKYFNPTAFGYENQIKRVMDWYDEYKKTHQCP